MKDVFLLRRPTLLAGSFTLDIAFQLMVSGKLTTVPRVDFAVMLVAAPGSTGENAFEKLQLPKRLTAAVPITGPVVSGPR